MSDARTFESEIEMARQRGIAVDEGFVKPVYGGRVIIMRTATNSWQVEFIPEPWYAALLEKSGLTVGLVNAAIAKPTEAEVLVERFPPGKTCSHCFDGAAGHELLYYDAYGEPVIGCIADRLAEEHAEFAIARRRQMLGGLR